VHGNKNDPTEPFAAAVASPGGWMNFSPTPLQNKKSPRVGLEAGGKTKALTQSGNHYEKGLLHM